MLKAIIREPEWLAHESKDGHTFHLNWIADVEDENGRHIDLHARLGEAIFMATHCVDEDEQAWVWGTWWGESPSPILRRGEAGSLWEAQVAAIAAGVELAESAIGSGRV
jgi:hypothetical protein